MSGVLFVEVKGGKGGVALNDISAILPDTRAPFTDSVVYTSLFPNGLEVKGRAEELCGLWWAWMEPEGDDDGDKT